MKKIKLIIGAATMLAASAFAVIKSVNWKVKDDYTVKFTSGGMQGLFKGLKATILFDESNPEKSKITASIDATSLNTGNAVMNEHAKEKEALHTAKFPLITFVSTAIKKTGSAYEASGSLTIKGITKEIKFPFIFDSKKNLTDRFPFVFKETFSGKIIIDPKDFNITRQGTPKEVIIDLTIPVTK